MGLAAHRLEKPIDRPVFRWFDRHHLSGEWAHVWLKLTNIGSPTVTQIMTVVAAAGLSVLYARQRFSLAPAATMLLAYAAEKYSQTILKLVVHRGHPPTTHGTWPSGGMGRVVDIYGLIIFFVITRFWPHAPRAWAAGGFLLTLLASIQAYARINNREHWLTDVVGGGGYGLSLLAMMILGYLALTTEVGDRAGEGRAKHAAGPAGPEDVRYLADSQQRTKRDK